MYRIVNYTTPDGKDLYKEWFRALRNPQARAAVEQRLIRIESGNFGDHKHCRDGVWELRLQLGPGYRVYYARMGAEIVLLLGGGDKSSQSSDIARAAQYWKQAQEEMK